MVSLNFRGLARWKWMTLSAQYRTDLEEFERHDGRPAFALNMVELKLLGIAGVRVLSQKFLLVRL